MKNTKAFITKLENEFNISISNFVYFSGNAYKASFDAIYTEDGENHTVNVVVKESETYKQAIQRALFKTWYLSMDV